MRSRSYSGGSNFASSFGPGPVTPAVKFLIFANIGVFLIQQVVRELPTLFGLRPIDVMVGLEIWQPVTYMFLHGSISHILFNMLSLWMFGTDLERLWGTPFFTRYYFVTGVGAGLTTILVSLLPIATGTSIYYQSTVGASGAVFGLLLAYGVTYPDRPIYLYFLFQIPAKYFVMIVGAVALFSSLGDRGGNVAHVTHLGGIVVGYVYLRGFKLGRFNLIAELKYRYLRWKINRMRRKFDVHPGGRTDDWDRKIH